MQEKTPFSVWKMLLYIAICLGAGALSGLLLQNSFLRYQALVRPPLSPPGMVFPIVWSVLYLLMGFSGYQISRCMSDKRQSALCVFWIQLFLNALWPLFFFGAGWYLFAFFWLLVLWTAVFYMVVLFYKLDKIAALLQIPYLFWLTFAGYLNLGVYLLN